MLGAVFNSLGELVAQDDQTPAPPTALVDNLKQRLGDCVTEDQSGRQRLSITLPDRQALDNLAETLAHLLVTQSSKEN